jgi:2-dehydro-3-deoxygluconokinase
MTPLVVTLGEAMIRLSPPRGDVLVDAQTLHVTVGGAESNVAVALASLGADARWLSALPDSALGRRVAGEIASSGVDVSHVAWTPDGRVGLYFVEHGVPPRPAAVLYDRAGSAAASMHVRDLTGGLDGATHAVVSGVTAALAPNGAALAAAFVEEAASRAARIYVDVNYRSRLWSPADARPVLAALASRATVVVCSAADARAVLGLDGADDELARALHSAVAPRAELVVITLGRNGAVAWQRDEGQLSAPGHALEAVDPIGAGDALLAGLIWAELDGRAPADALAVGVALAALACTVRGDHARFRPADVEAVLGGRSEKASR